MAYALLKDVAYLLSLVHGIRFLVAPFLGENRRCSVGEPHISPTGETGVVAKQTTDLAHRRDETSGCQT